MKKNTLNKKNLILGLIITFLFSFTYLFIIYGSVLKSPNTTYFSTSGDGLKAYYFYMYHVNHDSDYWRTSGMNYPFGEQTFYTDAQSLSTNVIKFISRNIFDISSYTIGIMNFLTLISIVFGALLMFMIFYKLKMPVLYSSLIAVAIIYLSPQIGRFSGHFSLSYLFFLPAILYLLMQFYEKRKVSTSIFIGLLTLFSIGTHMYFLGFFALILLFFWIYVLFFDKKNPASFKSFIINVFIQILIPVIIINAIMYFNDWATNRTSFPWGFLYYRAYPESVFLPIAKPYGRFLHKLSTFNYINWEGFAYIGFVAAIGFFIVFGKIMGRLFTLRFKNILRVTDNDFLNLLFWTSFASLLYSFGVPFILWMEDLVKYMGPIKQMRGISRFSWIFYYVMNIIVFYLIWQKSKSKKNIYIKYLWLLIPLAIIFYDAWSFSHKRGDSLNNKFTLLDDRENKLPENQWVHKISSENYQAIIPIPYFHIGSENIWWGNKCDIAKDLYPACLKTGLPTNAVMLSRTSINQTYKNLQIFLEPYRKLEILKDFESEKPFLLLVGNCDEISIHEKNIISKSKKILETKKFDLYELPFSVLVNFADSLKDNIKNEINSRPLFAFDNLLYSDSVKSFVYDNFNNLSSSLTYEGMGAKTGDLTNYNRIVETKIPNSKPNEDYAVSFWIGNFSKDLYPRSKIEILLKDSNENIYYYKHKDASKLLKIIDGDWALLEHKFKIKNPDDRLFITIRNDIIISGNLIVDDLLIRPEKENVYFISPEKVSKNTRYFDLIIRPNDN
ncbi:MAG: hypothetical protein JEY97_04190 [Bacteroidales bacterium]|nr:hypothetical protein [Bacteroidales bacterium]